MENDEADGNSSTPEEAEEEEEGGEEEDEAEVGVDKDLGGAAVGLAVDEVVQPCAGWKVKNCPRRGEVRGPAAVIARS